MAPISERLLAGVSEGKGRRTAVAADQTEATGRLGGLAPFGRVVGVGAVVLVGLSALPQFPVGVAVFAVAICALAALADARTGVGCAIVVLGFPLFYVNPVLGGLFIVVGLSVVPFLASRDGAPFFLLGGAVAAVAFHADWAVPLLAGFYLGTSEAVIIGVLAALGIEVAGFLAGHSTTGVLYTHGARDIVKLSSGRLPALTDFGWIVPRLKVLPPATLGSKVAKAFVFSPAMLAQPLLWGVAAGVTGTLAKVELKRALLAGAAGLTLLFVGQSLIVTTVPAGAVGAALLISTLLRSGLVAVAVIAATVVLKLREKPQPAMVSQAAQAPVAEQAPKEADVVDLLRTISHAEEQIREQFTQTATILLTDMKEFSKMTHEQGSIPSAKTVQKHRDLLMPVIEANGGLAKATGGDGIIAAFQDARSAIQSAVDMQNVLVRYNASTTEDCQVMIRIGINTGEVVFDKDGTPFIGDGLNVSARVMGLADGGQILLTKSTLEEAIDMGDFRWQYLGTRDLKGVAVGAHIYEILWHQGSESASTAPSPQTV